MREIAEVRMASPAFDQQGGISAVDEQDRRRRRGLIVFQVWIYGVLLTMFLIQLSMLLTRDW
ncbi:hypothetical protein A5697_08735 [Mycobacterium sp. E3251]|uniref:hypothetical protein n=1 Tax=unclassified Mycobacterium TaxID=2642494 RepID=UPI0007FBE637|nr:MULTISPECIES: hypothetical protein [unclassified Mycobacterium]OBG91888.1 hypothetical protein A5697_08735 [Mycobacterium sp. E3251]OBI24873.1 hypothetical protein A5709_09725 [Mycobacterium sp. E1386]